MEHSPQDPHFGHFHVAAAALNQTVGDWKHNTARIVEAIEIAQERGVRLLVFPEMCIPGYSLGDRLLRQGTITRSWNALLEIAKACTYTAALVGLPILHQGVVYNAMALAFQGDIIGLVAKENLATGDVEYESRWYQAWPRGLSTHYDAPGLGPIPFGNLIFDFGGDAQVAVEICEDGWLGSRPGSRYTVSGAEIIANPSASWFMIGKHATRRRMVEQISLEDHCAYLYTSLMGCDATRLVFDGSAFIAYDGEILNEGDRFVFDRDVVVIDRIIDLNDLRQKRMEAGSWRQQVAESNASPDGPQLVRIPGEFASTRAAEPAPPYWVPRPARSVDPSLDHLHANGSLPTPPTSTSLSHLELELALCMGLRDYTRKTGAGGYCLALSGGRDSAMVALLVHRMYVYDTPTLSPEERAAWIKERFVCAYMGTQHSSDATRNAARAVAEDCHALFLDGDVDQAVSSIATIGQTMANTDLSWDNPIHDIALQNVQARARGSIIWLIANIYRFVLLTTSNKSEAAVGYATMDGDTSGGLAPLCDVPKSLIQIWLAWARQYHGLSSVDHVLHTPATAELRPQEKAQTDEKDLMPFDILDQLMYHFIQRALDPLPMFKTLWPRFATRYNNDPKAFALHIRRFVLMLCRAQWKRERFAISFRVTSFDLDPKTGFRFPPVQSGFYEELQDLDTYVASLV